MFPSKRYLWIKDTWLCPVFTLIGEISTVIYASNKDTSMCPKCPSLRCLTTLLFMSIYTGSIFLCHNEQKMQEVVGDAQTFVTDLGTAHIPDLSNIGSYNYCCWSQTHTHTCTLARAHTHRHTHTQIALCTRILNFTPSLKLSLAKSALPGP